MTALAARLKTIKTASIPLTGSLHSHPIDSIILIQSQAENKISRPIYTISDFPLLFPVIEGRLADHMKPTANEGR